MTDLTPESGMVYPISGNTLKTGLGDEHRIICNSDGRLDVVIAAGTALIGYVKITDGTNYMPTMDTPGRCGFQKITDGTYVLDISQSSGFEAVEKNALYADVGVFAWDGSTRRLIGIDDATNRNLNVRIREGSAQLKIADPFANINAYRTGGLAVGAVVHGEDIETGSNTSEPAKVRTDDGTITAGEKHLEVISLGQHYNGTAWKRSRSDSGLNLVGTIEAEHFEIHEGAHYFLYDYDTDIDIVTPKYWHVIAPNTTTRIHVWFEIYTEAEAVIEIFESPTTTGNGTELTELNSDRNSANEATLTTFKDPTTTADGTLIMTFRNASEKKVGGVATRDQEIILKQAEQYLFKVTSDADDNKSVLHIQWYEV